MEQAVNVERRPPRVQEDIDMVMLTGLSGGAADSYDGLRSSLSSVAAEGPQLDAPRLTDAERRQLLAWNATTWDYSRDQCVPELVAHRAAIAPNAAAVVSRDHYLSYAELNQRANQLAHHLRRLGVGADVPVGVCVERSVDLVVALLGVLKAGGAYVPLDPSYPPLRLAFMLEDTQAPVVVTQASQAVRLPIHNAQVVCLDSDATVLVQQLTTDPAPTARAAHLAYVIYTSGSTGQPKGVQITHESLLNLIFWHQRAFSVSAADRATQLAGPAFDATVWELWPYLTIGASVYLPDEDTRVTPVRLRDWLIEQQITITFLPTALAERVIALAWPRETALRYLLTGADTLHRHPSHDLPFTLVNNYGPTENTVVTTSGPVLPTTRPGAGLPSIGRPVANTQVYILDEYLREVPIGEIGELYIGGAGLSRGYLHRPDLTAERFVKHPFNDDPSARLYRTGDLAHFLPDGQIAFVGRADTQIKIRGRRIEPDEIVSVLNGHPAIEASVITAKEDSAGDKSLVAYIVPTPGAQVTVNSLQEHLRTQLPDYMIPATFVRFEALPLTPNGKVDYRALPAPSAANTLSDAADAETDPRTLIEERVAEIAARLLNLPQVGLDDNFFAIGGHSLLGVQLVTSVGEAFGVDLALHTLFSAPTVRQLSAEVEGLILEQLEALSEEEAARLLQ
jgi:amino acid adenylation domain-containing protein